MWLRAFHLVSACVFSPLTSLFTTADIRHTAHPPSSTLTVLRAHLPLLSMIPYATAQPAHISSFVARASLFVQNKGDAPDGPQLPSCQRIASTSFSRTAPRSLTVSHGTGSMVDT